MGLRARGALGEYIRTEFESRTALYGLAGQILDLEQFDRAAAAAQLASILRRLVGPA
jgi:hypothetical protein